jgi:hypothetical protein
VSASVRFRLLLSVGVILGAVFVLVRLELAYTDWYYCFHAITAYRERTVWQAALAALTRSPADASVLAAAVLPTLLAIALSRRRALQLAAIAPMAFMVAITLWDSNSSTWHNCDRKGCVVCDGLFLWLLFIQLPITALLSIGLALQRLLEMTRRKRG